MTAIAGVIGHPIRHSLSPLIHTGWIRALGLNARYDFFDAEDVSDFDRWVQQIKIGELAGLNVTAPYKLNAHAAADQLSEAAQACGSANLLVGTAGGQLSADSTDAFGLLTALDQQAPQLAWPHLKVVLLGAGGAARSAAWAVRQRRAGLYIVNRTVARAQTLADDFGGHVGSERDLDDADLMINALSQTPDATVVERLPKTATVMDMSYRPLMTPLLQAASRRGLSVVDGLAMLVGQARPSFKALFGVEPPDLDVRSLALAALGDEA